MPDQFWEAVATSLAAAAKASTADELVAAVKLGPDQGSGSGEAFFAGSGGETQLHEVLAESDNWDIDWIEYDYHWTATSRADGSVVEYTEGDLDRRPA